MPRPTEEKVEQWSVRSTNITRIAPHQQRRTYFEFCAVQTKGVRAVGIIVLVLAAPRLMVMAVGQPVAVRDPIVVAIRFGKHTAVIPIVNIAEISAEHAK